MEGVVHVSSVYVHSAYMGNLFGVMVFHRSIVNVSVGEKYPSIGALCYMHYCGVTILHRCIVNWCFGCRYMLSICAFSICDTY